VTAPPSASYLAAHRYDHDRVEIDRRDGLTPIEIQRRDAAIVRDVWRYKLLATAQLQELWWPGRSQRAAQKRLTRLFQAGLLERFRPVTRRGSYPWIYQLGPEGHKLLRNAGLIPPRQRYERRDIYDYTYVLHDLHLNSWVLAYRRALRGALLEWDGETAIEPPKPAHKGQLRLDDNWNVEGLKAQQARTVVPDAVLEIARPDRHGSRVFLIEYDRTTRVDKNYEKFRRYDSFLTWWWRHTPYADQGAPPWVLFVCQNEQHRDKFLAAADHDLMGRLWHPSATPTENHYPGRRRILFACEADAHANVLEARRLPGFPPRDPSRRGAAAEAGRVRLPGPGREGSPAPGARTFGYEHALAAPPSPRHNGDRESRRRSSGTDLAEQVALLGEMHPAIASEE
jgi:Replication-relaxation